MSGFSFGSINQDIFSETKIASVDYEMAGSHSALTKLTGADGPICYFFSFAFVQYSLSQVLAGLRKTEQSSPVLQTEANLQKARESGMLIPCPLANAASWNAASSPGRHCELLYDGLDPGKGF